MLHQAKEVGTAKQKEIHSECKTLTYISLALTILKLVMVAILHYRKSKLCRRCTFSNAVKIMIFISDVQYYVPIKLCKTAGSIHLFKVIGMLKSENIKLNKITYGTLYKQTGKKSVWFSMITKLIYKSCYNQTLKQDQNQMLDEERTSILPPNA